MEAKYLVEISSYKWATLTASYGGNTYSGIIDPESFSGVTCRLDIESSGLISANDLSFDVINPAGTITRALVKGQFCIVRLIIDGTQSRAWKFIVTDAAEHNGLITIYAEGILNKAVRGSLPKTKKPKEIWPSDNVESDSDYVVPIILGTAYIPVAPIYDTDSVYYVMGDSTAATYTITEIQSPHDWGNSSIWAQADYTFTQSDLDGYKVVEPIIADSDGDTTADATGVWNSNGLLYPLLNFSRSDTEDLTSPEEWVEYLLESLGTASADVDTGASSTFETAGTTYASRSMAFNGGFWVPEDGESILRSVLIQCDSFLYNGEKIELHTFSATSVETFDRTDTIENSFGISPRTISESDGGHVEWVNSGDPQDVFTGKAEVRLYNDQASVEAVDSEVLTCRFLSDSQHAQIAGILYFAKKFLGSAEASFSVPLDRLSTVATIKPGQVITLNDAVIFGAEYDIIITELTFNDDNSVSISGVRLEYIEDWEDITTDEISVANYTEQAGEFSQATAGADGLNAGAVTLYLRSATIPDVPASTATYTFTTGVLADHDNGWTQAMPEVDGNPCWIITKYVAVTAPTDTIEIETGDWPTPVKFLEDGTVGQGVVKGVCFLRATSAPATPTGGSFASPTATGWSDGIPSGTAPVYMTTRLFTSDGESPQEAVWTTPNKIGEIGIGSKVQFSVTGSTLWHDVPATNDLYMRACSSADGGSSWSCAGATLIKGETGATGADGASGLNTAIISLYKKFTSPTVAPTGDFSGTFTYTFSTKTLSGGTLNGWTTAVPSLASGEYLWVRQATASSTTDTDTIAAAEFASAVSISGTGVDGTNGLNTATVYLYRVSTSSSTAPTAFSGTGTYTFATNVLSGMTLNSWTQTPPTVPAGSFLWVRQATASATTATDTIAIGEWSAAVVLSGTGVDGVAGSSGLNTATIFIYKRATTSPAVPSSTLTYTFSTKVLSGTLGGWTQAVPADDGNPLWVTTAVATATAPADTDTIATGEWASPAKMAENGTDGSDGADGLNQATVYLYQRKSTAPAVTDIADPVTYTFTTGAITGSIGSWARTVPSGADPLYVTGATAISVSATDTIARSEWSTPVIMAENGADGADGNDGVDATNWSSTIVFSSTDYNTVSWTAGSVYANGTTYAINAGNTGNMAAATFIYLAPATSTTVLQITTTASNAVGTGKILIAVAQNHGTTGDDAIFQVFGGKGGVMITADNIAANTITANEIAANTITAAKIAASTITSTEIFGTTLSVIAADCGTLTAGILQSTNFDTTHGFKLDLTNATMTVNAAAGLVVNAAGGITVSDGASLNLTVAANSASLSKIVFTDSVPNVRYEIVSSYVSASTTGTFLIDASTAAGSTEDHFVVQDFTYHQIGNYSKSYISLDADGPATLQGYTTTNLITIEGTSGVHVVGDTADGVICWGTGSTMVFAVATSASDYVGGVGAATKFYIKSDGEVHIYSDVIPSASGTCDLGSTTYELGDVFIADDKAVKFGNGQDASITYDEASTDKLKITCASGISLSGPITTVDGISPTTDGTKDLGTTAAAFGTAFVQAIKNPNDANGYSASLHDGDNDIRFKWDGTDLLVKIDTSVFKITLTAV